MTFVPVGIDENNNFPTAVTTVLDSRYLTAVSVRSLGAKGDGTTDDTAAIQNGINQVAVTGGALFFPPGVYLVNGLTLLDNVTLDGGSKHAVTIKLKNAGNQHVIQAGSFDANADGVKKATPLGCKTGGLRNLTIDGNKLNQSAAKHGLAYYGIDLCLHNVEVKNASGTGIFCESPGATFSNVAGQNLQFSWWGVESHDNAGHGIVYNGQSDSTLLDIVCYQNGTGAGQANFWVKSKGTGIRVVGMHCWGTSDYGIVNEAGTAEFRATHVESAAVAKVWIKAATHFEGRVYEAGTNNAAPAFLLATGFGFNAIRATVSACDTVVKFSGADSGSNLFDILAYSTNATAKLFDGTLAASSFVRALLSGNVSPTTVRQ